MFNPFDYFRDRRSLLAIIDDQNRANDLLHRQLGDLADAKAEAERWKAACASQAMNGSKLQGEADARERKLADFRAIADQCKKDRDAATAQTAELSESVERMAKERDEAKKEYDNLAACYKTAVADLEKIHEMTFDYTTDGG